MDKNNERKQEYETEIPKETISLTAVFIFLGFVLAMILSMLFYLRFSSWSPFSDFFHKHISTDISFLDIYNKQKTDSTSSNISGTDIKLTENELGQMIGIQNSDFPLKKATLVVKPEGVIVSGKTSTAFWGVPVEVTLMPKVVDGKVIFEITEIKAAGVVAPPKISGTLTTKLSTLFTTASNQINKINISNVRTMVGYILLEIGG
jgi:hypothetical protein